MPRKRQDAAAVLALMADVTGDKPQMWGSNIVGFGRYQYKYAGGRRGVVPDRFFAAQAESHSLHHGGL